MNISRRNVIGGGLALAAAGLVSSESRAVAATGTHLQDITTFRLADGSFVQVNSSFDQAPKITEALRSPLVSGWYFPAGTYHLETKVAVTVKKHLVVHCDPQAIFQSKVNGDTFRFMADGGDAGVDVIWDGGRFDSTNQPVSQVVPWDKVYPPPPHLDLGDAAASASGLLTFVPRTSARVPIGSFGHISVTNTVMAGHGALDDDSSDDYDPSDHYWELAGGDTGIFIGSCQSAYLAMNSFRGMRDLGIYLSSPDNKGAQNVTIADNSFIGCAHGAAIKRGGTRYTVVRNTFRNCIRGFISEPTLKGEAGGWEVVVSSNEFDRCWESVKLQVVSVALVEGNRFTNLGHQRPDNLSLDKAPFTYSRGGFPRLASAVVVDASVYIVVRYNEVAGIHSSWNDNPTTAVLVESRQHPDSPERPTSKIVRVEKNWVYDVGFVAVEVAGEATNVGVASNVTGPDVGGFSEVNPGSSFTPLDCS